MSRTSGSHCRLVHATDPARKVTVWIHGGDLKRARYAQSSAKPVLQSRNSSACYSPRAAIPWSARFE
jgi:hypothetical protein